MNLKIFPPPLAISERTKSYQERILVVMKSCICRLKTISADSNIMSHPLFVLLSVINLEHNVLSLRLLVLLMRPRFDMSVRAHVYHLSWPSDSSFPLSCWRASPEPLSHECNSILLAIELFFYVLSVAVLPRRLPERSMPPRRSSISLDIILCTMQINRKQHQDKLHAHSRLWVRCCGFVLFGDASSAAHPLFVFSFCH